MANDSEERDRATEILQGGFSPEERGVERRGLSMTPESRLNPERARRGYEQARLEESRERTVAWFRSRTELRPPIPVSQMAVVGRFWGETAEVSRHLMPFLSPGADLVFGLIEDLYTAVTGQTMVYSEFETREATALERALAVLDIALTLIPEAAPVLRQAGKAGQMASRFMRSAEEFEGPLRVLNRFSARREAIELATVDLRLGRRPAPLQARALQEFVGELSVESRRVTELARSRGTAGRATIRSAETPRAGPRSSPRSTRSGVQRRPARRVGRQAERRPQGRTSRRRGRNTTPATRMPRQAPPNRQLADVIEAQEMAESFWAAEPRSSQKTIAVSASLEPMASGPGYRVGGRAGASLRGDFPSRVAANEQSEARHQIRMFEELSGEKPPRGRDTVGRQTIRGSAFASHAEIKNFVAQVDLGLDEAIGVSNDMCAVCRGFFQRAAVRLNRVIKVGDPHYIRVFTPSGVEIYTAEGAFARTVPPGVRPAATANNYVGVEW